MKDAEITELAEEATKESMMKFKDSEKFAALLEEKGGS